jgi:transposase
VTCQTYAPRKAVWLLLHRPEELTENKQADLASILQATAEVALVYPLTQSFRRLIAHGDPDRDPAGVLSWVEAAAASAAPEVRRFAQGLKQDLNAVLAAFRLPWTLGTGRRAGEPPQDPEAPDVRQSRPTAVAAPLVLPDLTAWA